MKTLFLDAQIPETAETAANIIKNGGLVAIPTKECCETPGCSEDPCEMFSRIPFPAGQFAPNGCDGCGCNDHTPDLTATCDCR